jgi:hypothetical protein
MSLLVSTRSSVYFSSSVFREAGIASDTLAISPRWAPSVKAALRVRVYLKLKQGMDYNEQ